MKYTIHGSVLQAATFELKRGESVFSEAGNMSWMSDNIKMTTTSHGLVEGIKRRLSGESLFLNHFQCVRGNGIVTFASEFPGKVLPIDVRGKELILQKDAFMCAESGVTLKAHLRKRLGAGFFGGEGFILQKVSGKGLAFVELAGEVIEHTLKKGQRLRVSTGHVAMFEPTVDFDIEFVGGLRNVMFGGEGFFLSTLTGPGKVWLQTMPLGKLASKIGKHLFAKLPKRRSLTTFTDAGRI